MQYKLGELIKLSEEKNHSLQYDSDHVRGISTAKEFIQTKADLDGVKMDGYKVVKPFEFAYVADTSRRGDKISLAFNLSNESYLVSSISTVFKLDEKELDSSFLYMFFNRPEFDRYARYHSWGSAREVFSWADLCDIEIDLPPIDIQKKYVAVYKAMLANQQAYEQGLDELKMVCDGFLENLIKENTPEKIGSYLSYQEETNSSGEYKIDDVKGISIQKKFIETKANMANVSLKNYLVVKPKHFSFVPTTSRNGGKITIANNNSEDTYIVSSSYEVFSVDETKIYPEYLAMFFNRSEFDRYARYHSWGSAREVFSWVDLCEVKIPVPDLDIQKSIVDIYKVYLERKAISEKLKEQIKNICPVLIKGATDEAKKLKTAS